MKNSLAIVLSACSTHHCLAFAGGAFRVSPLSSDGVLAHHASSCPRWGCSSNAPEGRRRPHQRRPHSLLRAAEEGGDGVAESGDESGGGDGGAGAGMGLDGEWQVKTGQGRKARAGEGVGAVPGQLPEQTRDGQDWAEWAREWREDPQGKADRLVGQWEAESKETGGSQSLGKSKKRSSKKKKKKKGSAGPSRGVVGSGFGGPARPTKSVPKGLVVAETGTGTGDVVDWSTGQQLAETDRRENMAADWQQDAQHLESLDPSDREKLAEKLRMALGKKPQKPKKKAPSAGDGRGFSSDGIPAGGKSTKKGGGGGDGRGVLASAAAAAGAVGVDDVGGVAVFPSAPAEAPGAVAAGLSGAGPLAAGVAPVQGEIKGDEGVVLGGGASVGDGVQIPGSAATAVEEYEATPSSGSITSPVAEESGREGEGVPLERVMGFGKGVAIVDASSSSSSEDPSRDEAEGAPARSAESSPDGVSVEDDKLSNVLNFGRGVAIPTAVVGVEDGVEEGSVVAEEKGEPEVAAADARLSGFGRGVAFPVESEGR